METIYEVNEEQDINPKGRWFKQTWRRLSQPTLSINDCSFLLYLIIGIVTLSFSLLSDNLLEIFVVVSKQRESVASAYTQILSDLQYAFIVVGGLLADCIYGRLPVMSASFLVYTVGITVSLLTVSYLSPAFYIVFILTIISCFLYGVVMASSITLLLNYAYISSTNHSRHMLMCIAKILGIIACTYFCTRIILYWSSFIIGFQILSVLYLTCTIITTRISMYTRHHYINIPIQGNPMKEYSHTARVLSREYNYTMSDPSQIKTLGVLVLHQASADYYTRSVSQDSVDAVDGSPPIIRATSVDQFYTAQEVIIPTSTTISPLFSNSADLNTLLYSNCDEPPSSHQGVHIKVIRPVKSYQKEQQLLNDYQKEKKNREMAFFLRNGIETNLVGRNFFNESCIHSLELYRVTQLIIFASLHIVVWCSLEYTQCVLLAQLNTLTNLSHPTQFSLFLTDLLSPFVTLCTILITIHTIYSVRSLSQYKLTSLQIIGLGYIATIISMIVTSAVNSFILLVDQKHLSIAILSLPSVLTVISETWIMIGSLLLFYEESPRRSQAMIISLVFLSRYCGSLLFYVLLPVLNSLCKLDSQSSRIIHYEFGLLLQVVLMISILGVFIWRAMKYSYVTESELDKECESLKPSRIIHPYLTKVNEPIKNRSKSCDSGIGSSATTSLTSSSSSRSSTSVRSLSDEILMSSISRSQQFTLV